MPACWQRAIITNHKLWPSLSEFYCNIQTSQKRLGKPVIKGTRIPVKIVLERLAHDLDTKTLFEDYPRLTEEDVKATLTYAESLLEQEE